MKRPWAQRDFSHHLKATTMNTSTNSQRARKGIACFSAAALLAVSAAMAQVASGAPEIDIHASTIEVADVDLPALLASDE
jgi:hypothetical protein